MRFFRRQGAQAWAGSGLYGTLAPPTIQNGDGARRAAQGEVLHGWDRYIQLVALAYEAAPMREAAAVPAFHALETHVQRVFRRMQSRVRVQFVPYDPYPSAEAMQKAIRATGTMEVMALHHQSAAWSDEVNLQFRAIHDFYGHLLAGLKADRLHQFTIGGELAAYNKHAQLLGRRSRALPALFTEVLGQVSFFNYFGAFPDQKVALLPQFDPWYLGRVEGYSVVGGDLVPRAAA